MKESKDIIGRIQPLADDSNQLIRGTASQNQSITESGSQTHQHQKLALATSRSDSRMSSFKHSEQNQFDPNQEKKKENDSDRKEKKQGEKMISNKNAILFEHGGCSLSEVRAGVLSLTLNLPGEKVNKFNLKMMESFEAVLTALESEKFRESVQALVVRSGKSKNFIAGADLEMIQKVQSSEDGRILSSKGQELLNRWEDLPFVTIAAIEGAALGGGLEFALSCTAIVTSDDPSTRLGLPEVQLGILPGMGGTVRLPRKVSLPVSLEMILSGKTFSGIAATKVGLSEKVFPSQNFEASVFAWLEKELHFQSTSSTQLDLANQGRPKTTADSKKAKKLMKVTERIEGLPLTTEIIFQKTKKMILQKTKGHYPAPLKALEVIKSHLRHQDYWLDPKIWGLKSVKVPSRLETSTSKGAGSEAQRSRDAERLLSNGKLPKLRGAVRARAMQVEAKAFGELSCTEISRNLIRIFFLTEGIKKKTGLEGSPNVQLSKLKQKGAPAIQKIGVLGAGVMGGGIAQLFAEKDFKVRMKDISAVSLETGIQMASNLFKKKVSKKIFTPRVFLQKMAQITPVLTYEGFEKSQVVVEAIVENLNVKMETFKELEKNISNTAIIASNTSSLSISKMQEVLKNPERFLGLHFFNPVHKMPLVEIIRGEKTSDESVATLFALSQNVGKMPVVVRDAPGFLVNRLLLPYLNEAIHLVAEGVDIARIDQLLVNFGMPMGPLELVDEVGVDVGSKVSHILHEAFGDRMAPSHLHALVVQSGRLGKKKDRGFYVYEGVKKKKRLDPSIYSIMGLPVSSSSKISNEEILFRCILPMINEAFRCLSEKVVQTADEVDLAMILGMGFPAFRGGLLRYADNLGLPRVQTELEKLHKKLGIRFEPSPALIERVALGESIFKAS